MNLSQDPALKKELESEHLVYVTSKAPGFFRQKNGKSFAFYDLDGKRIHNKTTLSRIKGLVVPPAWKNVSISPLKNSHLQTTCIQLKGRTQYIYHLDSIKTCQVNKVTKVVDFVNLIFL